MFSIVRGIISLRTYTRAAERFPSRPLVNKYTLLLLSLLLLLLLIYSVLVSYYDGYVERQLPFSSDCVYIRMKLFSFALK